MTVVSRLPTERPATTTTLPACNDRGRHSAQPSGRWFASFCPSPPVAPPPLRTLHTPGRTTCHRDRRLVPFTHPWRRRSCAITAIRGSSPMRWPQTRSLLLLLEGNPDQNVRPAPGGYPLPTHSRH